MKSELQNIKAQDFAADGLVDAIQNRLDEMVKTGVRQSHGPGVAFVEAMLRRYSQRPSRYLLSRIRHAVESLEKDVIKSLKTAEKSKDQLQTLSPERKKALEKLIAEGRVREVIHGVIRHHGGQADQAATIRRLTQQVERGELINPAYSGTLSFDDFLMSQERDILDSVYQDNETFKQSDNASQGETEPFTELRSIKHFRESWVKLNSERLLAQAIADTPKDAGPLNSHRLAIQSLTAMRDLSPEYLNRFLSYLETLLWLEKAGESIGLSPRGKNKKPNNLR